MNGNNTHVFIIQLDRPRELWYGHKALKTLVALTGNQIEDLEQGARMLIWSRSKNGATVAGCPKSEKRQFACAMNG